ncbi:acyl-CoA dehydrogenase C-terminal domain-containing protein [Acinetobacter baumannii]|uniref:acyl-CoA dehydrogenase C-terminal domain-containing protein n=1 Tax=Acinetobacter baumannii TaxID=470 RepID=UPI0005CA6EFE|nr:acyl-CoA dehydrogenase C-terminal domain-containing protein [Acinetobacter baumannii]
MPAYKAPLHDIRFLMNEVLDYPAHYKTLSNGESADPDTVDMILEGAADYCENVLSPLNQSGDEEGCHFDNGEVKTPKGFKEAYDQFVMGGWQGLSYPEEFGGQGLPMSLNQNIIHIVLARLPDAPAGTRGISLFIVPKFIPTADGGVGERNTVSCGSIEHKMGIRASATAVLNFDNATGYLIGEVNKGLHAMFTFMNTARIGTAVQGIAHAELSFQGALPYAKERMSMRALSGKKDPDKVADAIIHHADVRRMLLTQKAIAEGGRSMIYYAAQLADKMTDALTRGDQAAFEDYDDKLGFYTPILKGFLTELGLEAANHGMQVYGGHGYIKEWGMEQIVRDARISTLYEGTTGVQALDLIGRKVLLSSKGKVVREYTAEILKFCAAHARNKYLRRFAWDLTKLCAQWNTLTVRIMLAARKDRDIVSSASVDFLMFSGYVMMAYFWAQQAVVASEKLEAGNGQETPEFYKAKIKVADFYFDRLLPRAQGHAESMVTTSRTLTSLPAEHFSFDY